jgi:hypothetical protein
MVMAAPMQYKLGACAISDNGGKSMPAPFTCMHSAQSQRRSDSKALGIAQKAGGNNHQHIRNLKRGAGSPGKCSNLL